MKGQSEVLLMVVICLLIFLILLFIGVIKVNVGG